MKEPSDRKIRKAALKFLKHHSNDANPLHFKELRRYISNKLSLPSKYLKGRKDFLRSVAKEYQENISKVVELEKEAIEEEKEEGGRIQINKTDFASYFFTKTENRIINQMIDSFAEEQNIHVRELNPATATDEKDKLRHRLSELVQRLRIALPNRGKMVGHSPSECFENGRLIAR